MTLAPTPTQPPAAVPEALDPVHELEALVAEFHHGLPFDATSRDTLVRVISTLRDTAAPMSAPPSDRAVLAKKIKDCAAHWAYVASIDHEDQAEVEEARHAELVDALVAAAAPTTEQAGGGAYVQTVPDHCDRIVWRGHYYGLPLAAPGGEAPAPAAAAASDAAGGTLWCVNVQGPDDVHAMPTRAAALERANELNEVFGRHKFEEGDPIMRAVVIEWPHCASSHAVALRLASEAAQGQEGGAA